MRNYFEKKIKLKTHQTDIKTEFRAGRISGTLWVIGGFSLLSLILKK